MPQYQIEAVATKHFQDAARSLGASFIARNEPSFLFDSSYTCLSVACIVTAVDIVHRPDRKPLDVKVSFDVVDCRAADIRESKDAQELVSHFMEVMSSPSTCYGRSELSIIPAGPNSFYLGLLDHYGDPEVLMVPKVKRWLEGFQFELKAVL